MSSQEVPTSGATCETINVRGLCAVDSLTVRGVPVLPGGALASDGVTLQGTGLPGAEFAIKAVQHDGTMSGNGTVASPLSATAPAAAVVFDTVGGATNLRGNQTANRSPIDNTKARVVNLSSKTGTVNAGATGATANGAAIPGGDDNSASGVNSATIGQGNTAAGLASFVAGAGCSSGVGGVAGVAMGNSAAVSGFAGLSVGNSTLQSGAAGATFGNSCIGASDTSLTGGQGSIAGAGGAAAASSVAWGLNCTTKGPYAQAFGDTCAAEQNCDFVAGRHSKADFPDAVALGAYAYANRSTQFCYSGDPLGAAVQGGTQRGWLPFGGVTPGVAINEAVVLVYHVNGLGFVPEDNKAYYLRMTCAAGGVQAGPTPVAARLNIELCVKRIAGVSTICGAVTTTATVGDATAADWTLVPTVHGGPDNITFTFTTGAVITAAKVTAFLEWEEIKFQ